MLKHETWVCSVLDMARAVIRFVMRATVELQTTSPPLTIEIITNMNMKIDIIEENSPLVELVNQRILPLERMFAKVQSPDIGCSSLKHNFFFS